jgi:hypothetical protein
LLGRIIGIQILSSHTVSVGTQISVSKNEGVDVCSSLGFGLCQAKREDRKANIEQKVIKKRGFFSQGPGSADPYFWIPDPALYFSYFQDANKK